MICYFSQQIEELMMWIIRLLLSDLRDALKPGSDGPSTIQPCCISYFLQTAFPGTFLTTAYLFAGLKGTVHLQIINCTFSLFTTMLLIHSFDVSCLILDMLALMKERLAK